MFLVLLLIRGFPAVFKNWQVTKISFQTKHLGLETDDFIAVCSRGSSDERKLVIQAKRNFKFGPSYPDCAKTFQEFWKDFKETKINPNKDALVLATNPGSGTLKALDSLFECARNSSTEEDFAHRLASSTFLPRHARDCVSKIKLMLEKADSTGVGAAELWRFLKSIHILFLDFGSSAHQEAICKSQLALASTGPDPPNASNTWKELLEIAADAASGAKQLLYSNLPKQLRISHRAIPIPPTDLQILIEHSATTIDAIKTTIGNELELPRKDAIAETAEALVEKQAIVLSGPPGYGKSALAKAVVQQQTNDHVCLSFRAEEFAESHIDRVLPGSITGQRFGSLMGAQKKVLLHVESLERLLEHTVRAAFSDLVELVRQLPNVRLLLTCRDYSTSTIVEAFLSSLAYGVIEVQPLSEEEMAEVTTKFSPLAVPMSRPQLRRLLAIPYYLDMAVKIDWGRQQDMPHDVRTFRKKCWSVAFRNDALTKDGLPSRREKALVELAVRRARKLRPLVSTDGIDLEALSALSNDGIVRMGEFGYAAPAHDVIEDWAIMHWMERTVDEHEWQAVPIAKDIGQHPAIRRGFREWLKEALGADADLAYGFVLSSHLDRSLPQNFSEDVLVSTLLSNSARNFICRQRPRLLDDGAGLLIRLIHLVRVACREVPKQADGKMIPLSIALEPDGEAWTSLMEITAEELDQLLPAHTEPILGLLEDWSRRSDADSRFPDREHPADNIANRLLEQLDGYGVDRLRKRILATIARAPRLFRNCFSRLVDWAPDNPNPPDMVSEEFARLLIDGTSRIQSCRDFPEQMRQLTLSWCCLSEQDLGSLSGIGADIGIDLDFGLNPHLPLGFMPQSAIRGPFLHLLTRHQDTGIQLVLEIVNHAGDWYGNRKWPGIRLEACQLISISIPGNGEIRQWANDRLWNAYRGTSVSPRIVQCALMALEAWLLDMCKESLPVESLLLKILRESNNVMTTAVVASVCNAYPELCSTAALVLLKSRECIELDRRRLAKERESGLLAGLFAIRPSDKIYTNERKKSNALHHRQHDLAFLCLKLQFAGMADPIHSIIDSHRGNVPEESKRTEDDRYWLLALDRMDSRRLTIGDPDAALNASGLKEGGADRVVVPLVVGETDPELQDFADSVSQESKRFHGVVSLCNWALGQWNRNSDIEDADSWQGALASARSALEGKTPLGDGAFLEGYLGVVAAVCVRDHLSDMSDDDRQWCIDTLVAEVFRDSDSDNMTVQVAANTMSPDRHAAYVLPMILSRDPRNEIVLEAVARAITHASEEVSIWATKGIAEYLAPGHQELALRCVGAVATYSNKLAGHERLQLPGVFPEYSNALQIKKDLVEHVRHAFILGSIDVDRELSKYDWTSRSGRYFSRHILLMLSKMSGLSHLKDFFVKAARVVVDAWSADQDSRDALRNSSLDMSTITVMANIVLRLPAQEAAYCCQPFLDAVERHPDRVADFIGILAGQQDGLTYTTPFWDVWQAFADSIIHSSWRSKIHSSHSIGMKLVNSMLFEQYSRVGPKRLDHLVGNEYRINEFASNLPAASPVLAGFAGYLFSVGRSSLPGAFSEVAKCLSSGNPTGMLDDENTVFQLELLLQPYVYGKPESLKADPILRQDVLLILNRLVDAGSPAAFKMRDDFVTPGV